MRATRAVTVFSLVLASAALVAWVWWAALPVVDDAAISISYGLSFWEGFGLRLTHFAPRVEGFTSILWALWTGLGAHLGIDALAFAHWSGPFFALLGAIVLGTGPFSTRVPTGALALVACVLFPSVGFWLSSGMETGLQIATLALGLWVALSPASKPVTVGAVLGAMPLVRPEYLALGGLLLALWSVTHLKARSWRPVLIGGLAWAAVVGAMFAVRLAYFGDLLPNTYYIKRKWDFNGPNYAGAFLTQHLPLMGAFVVGLLGLAFAGWWRHLVGFLLVVAGGLQFGAKFGDWMREWRFLVPLVPFLAAPAALAWGASSSVPKRLRRGAARVCAVVALGLVVGGAVMQRDRHVQLKSSPEFPATFVMENARRFRQQLASAGVLRPQVGFPDIGGLALVYRDGVVVDVAGLADYAIAHASGFPVMEDYFVNEGPPMLVDAHGPSGHVAGFKSLRQFIPGWGGGLGVLPLTPAEDPRCPGLKPKLSASLDEATALIGAQLERRQPVEALRTWNCVVAYSKQLPSWRATEAWAARALALADELEPAQPELALRYLSFAATVGDDVWARRRAEQLRERLVARP